VVWVAQPREIRGQLVATEVLYYLLAEVEHRVPILNIDL
jgi:hypothetical protein